MSWLACRARSFRTWVGLGRGFRSLFTDDAYIVGVRKPETSGIRWGGILLLVICLALALILIPNRAEPQRYGIRIPPPPPDPVTWVSPRADSTDVPATYLDEADPLQGRNGSPNGLTVSHTPGSGDQCVALLTWAASIADSIVGTVDSAAVTLYRLDSSHPGANDSLEIAPLVASWNEGAATWLNRSAKKPWVDPGGDVDESLAVVVRAADIAGLYAGGLDDPVTIPITPIVEAWKAGTPVYGLRLAWRTGSSPVVRFHDNNDLESVRPVLTVISQPPGPGMILGDGRFGIRIGWKRVGMR
jgi:hypothetical protein